MDWEQAVYFFSYPRLAFRARLALRAKRHVRLAWLIKRLLCRLNADHHSFSRTSKVLLSKKLLGNDVSNLDCHPLNLAVCSFS